MVAYQKQQKKKNVKNSGLKSGWGTFWNLSSVNLRESVLNSIWLTNKTIFTKWSLMGDGRLREVVAERVDCIFFV